MAKSLPSCQLPCPCCGEETASLSLHLATLDDTGGENFTCQECDTAFSVDSVREFIAKWGTFLAWLDTIPGATDSAG